MTSSANTDAHQLGKCRVILTSTTIPRKLWPKTGTLSSEDANILRKRGGTSIGRVSCRSDFSSWTVEIPAKNGMPQLRSSCPTPEMRRRVNRVSFVSFRLQGPDRGNSGHEPVRVNEEAPDFLRHTDTHQLGEFRVIPTSMPGTQKLLPQIGLPQHRSC